MSMSVEDSSALRLSANISMLFTEAPFLARFALAKAAGFAAVECHFPYAFALSDLAACLRDHDLVLNGINTPAGDVERGEFGFASVPGREDDFRRSFDQSLEWAVRLKVASIHCMCGVVAPEQSAEARQVFLRNMSYAAQAVKGMALTLLVEPINQIDRPGWFCSKSDELVALLIELGEEQVKLMFDFYHIQISEGDLLRRMQRHWDHIGHFQFASVPGRAEPDVGEISYKPLFAEIARRHWSGWVAAEYRPKSATQAGLGWMRTLVPV